MDQAILPVLQDRVFVLALLVVTFLGVPWFIDDYWANAVFLPFLAYAMAAIGLNLLTGYCGQVSLGTGGFMAVGALEPQFYLRLLELLGLADAGLPAQYDQSSWPEVSERIAAVFAESCDR